MYSTLPSLYTSRRQRIPRKQFSTELLLHRSSSSSSVHLKSLLLSLCLHLQSFDLQSPSSAPRSSSPRRRSARPHFNLYNFSSSHLCPHHQSSHAYVHFHHILPSEEPSIIQQQGHALFTRKFMFSSCLKKMELLSKNERPKMSSLAVLAPLVPVPGWKVDRNQGLTDQSFELVSPLSKMIYKQGEKNITLTRSENAHFH